jgi:glycosyltransferase involved in cell wall biosynthesis
MSQRILTALPVYNEATHVSSVLDEVRRYSPQVLVVDDGSTDGTRDLLAQQPGIHLVTHEQNRGYGAALQSAFDYALAHRYDVLVTIDCDGQHEPQRIPKFVAACEDWDIVSGSRYLKRYEGDTAPPADRRRLTADHRRTQPAAACMTPFAASRPIALRRHTAPYGNRLRHAANCGCKPRGAEDPRVAVPLIIWI